MFLPGIDDNQSKTEVTQLSNARRILSFARDQSLGLLSIWAGTAAAGSPVGPHRCRPTSPPPRRERRELPPGITLCPDADGELR